MSVDIKLSQYSVFVAALSVVESLPIEAKIKWINDIFVNDQKIAGILTRGAAKGKKCVVSIGIGVNLN